MQGNKTKTSNKKIKIRDFLLCPLQPTDYKLKTARGFTLIEIMVAIAIFTIIMVMGVSALLNANTVHKVAANQRSLIDNLNFMMEDMARNLRLGNNYSCNNTGCAAGSREYVINFDGIDGNKIAYAIGQPSNIPNLCNGSSASTDFKLFKSIDGGGCFSNITPNEINIDPESGFFVSGIGADGLQPAVLIRLYGTTNYKGVTTPFDIETVVTQRATDE